MISDIQKQIYLRFSMANSIDIHLRLKIPHYTYFYPDICINGIYWPKSE